MSRVMYPIACGIDVNKKKLACTIIIAEVCRWNLFTITANSLLTIMTLLNSLTGLIIMTATASVWNLQASIEFLYLTTLKIVILILLSLIQSMLNHRKVKNLIS